MKNRGIIFAIVVVAILVLSSTGWNIYGEKKNDETYCMLVNEAETKLVEEGDWFKGYEIEYSKNGICDYTYNIKFDYVTSDNNRGVVYYTGTYNPIISEDDLCDVVMLHAYEYDMDGNVIREI